MSKSPLSIKKFEIESEVYRAPGNRFWPLCDWNYSSDKTSTITWRLNEVLFYKLHIFLLSISLLVRFPRRYQSPLISNLLFYSIKMNFQHLPLILFAAKSWMQLSSEVFLQKVNLPKKSSTVELRWMTIAEMSPHEIQLFLFCDNMLLLCELSKWQ